jgi:hypothetical protein
VCVLDDLQRQVSTAQLATSLQRALGADVEVPDWGEVRGEFDAWLVSRPDVEDPDRAVLMRALGLRR